CCSCVPRARGLVLGYTLSPAARACVVALPTQGSRTLPGLHAVARCAGLRTRVRIAPHKLRNGSSRVPSSSEHFASTFRIDKEEAYAQPDRQTSLRVLSDSHLCAFDSGAIEQAVRQRRVQSGARHRPADFT